MKNTLSYKLFHSKALWQLIIVASLSLTGMVAQATDPLISKEMIDRINSKIKDLDSKHAEFTAKEVGEMWKTIANEGDTYAGKAYKIFADPFSFEHCALTAHWDNVLGEEKRKSLFNIYGRHYQKKYIAMINNKWKKYKEGGEKDKSLLVLPSSNDIEEGYLGQIKQLNSDEEIRKKYHINYPIPEELAIDLVLNDAREVEGIIGDWTLFVGIPKERMSPRRTRTNLPFSKALEYQVKDGVLSNAYCAMNLVQKVNHEVRKLTISDKNCPELRYEH